MSELHEFFDPGLHFDWLARMASSRLATGDGAAAFRFVDRRCRSLAPNARDFLLRAEASRLSGYAGEAIEDLERALTIDPTDILANRSALRWGNPPMREAAAWQLLADPLTDTAALKEAIAFDFERGRRLIVSLHRFERSLRGWIVWRGAAAIDVRVVNGPNDCDFSVAPDSAHPLADGDRFAADISIDDHRSSVSRVEFLIDGAVVRSLDMLPSIVHRPRGGRVTSAAAMAGAAPKLLTIVIPMYEGYETSRACLASVHRSAAVETKIVIVNDSSPNQDLSNFLDAYAESHDVELLKNDVNIGFAASVNGALRQRERGDVLLLNSDVVLPPGAVDRLIAAAYVSDDVGTVTPLSNNGEFTSFPWPNETNPLPSAEAIERIAKAAAAANGSQVVDLPNGIGFCLYIKATCLEAVGLLPDLYSRGYFEDVDLCLKAAEKGFRNVCAVGVYVGHAGTISFGSAKRALVVRNRAIIEARFPHYRARCEAFLAADPLKPMRAAIELALPPNQEIILMCSSAGRPRMAAETRGRQIGSAETEGLVVHCTSDTLVGSVDLSGLVADAPQSLRFSFLHGKGLAALRRYLQRLKIIRVEIFHPAMIPDSLLSEYLALKSRLELNCADIEWFGEATHGGERQCRDLGATAPCPECLSASSASSSIRVGRSESRRRLRTAFERADAVRPADRMTEMFCRRTFGSKTISLAPRAIEPAAIGALTSTRRVALGVLVPCRSALIDRQIVFLGREFARRGGEMDIIVLGQGVDDLALMASLNVFVVGPVEDAEYGRLLNQYAIAALMLPHRTSFFGLLDWIAGAAKLPKAYFDCSFGRLAVGPLDLALDPRICATKAALAIADWHHKIIEPREEMVDIVV
jgi:O-antigen biosynthesis protein